MMSASMHPLSPRQQSILNRTVETHIETAQPVGSRSLTDLYTGLYRASYSPATVRAEMGQLESMGYLTHPHTSAGRIPTDLGYRYYVDHGLKEEAPSEDLMNRVYEELTPAASEATDTFAENASRLLSQMTDELSLVVISDSRRRSHRLFFQGSSRMLEKPEFQNLDRVRPILKTLEEKAGITAWLLDSAREDVSVRIGHENEPEAFRCCSVVAMRCGSGENPFGALAVFGPRRMNYSRTLPLVNRMTRIMKEILNNTPSRESLS
jgi:heat-inducible transcriptional repressor